MSVSASISISLAKRGNYTLSAVDIIKRIINNNWRINNKGKTCYLPLGDDDIGNWKEEEISEKEFMEIVSQKEMLQEIIGVNVFWEYSEIGAIMLIFPDYDVSFDLTINRMKIDLSMRYSITDANWYFERILPCFCTEDLLITTVKFMQD